AAVDERDPGQRQVGAHAVGDGEVECPLDRAAFLGTVGGQRVGGDAHQLEPDEQVEDVTGQAEAGHAREEREHQHVEVRPDLGEVPPGEHERRGRQHRAEAGEPGVQRAGLEVDADRDATRRTEAGEPVDGARSRLEDQDEEHDGDGHRRADRDQAADLPFVLERGAEGEQRRGGQQRDRNRQREELVHQPLNSASSCGSSVPNRLCAWTANDSSSAVTAASTTTSVSANAWTTGSTALACGEMSKKYGATPPVTYPTASSST